MRASPARQPPPLPPPPPPRPTPAARAAAAALAAVFTLTPVSSLPSVATLATAAALTSPPAASAADASKVGKCLLSKCRAPLARCLADGPCAANLVCLNACAGRPDETACQIRCGDLHASPAIDSFNDCAVSAAGCVPQRVDDGAYPVPTDDALDANFDINAFTGRWFITAGLNPLFDIFPCQEHFFGVPEPGRLAAKVNWRIPLDARGRFSPRSVIQTFKQCPNQKALLLNHDNEYLHYTDDWYILASKPDTYVVVYYRGANDAWSGYGGAVVYTRLRKLPTEFVPEFEAAVSKVGLKWTDFTVTDNTCGAQPPPPTLAERVEDAERVIAEDAAAIEKTIEADAVAIERTIEADALAVERVLAADASALATGAAALPSRVAAAAAAAEGAAEGEARDVAAFLERVEKAAVEGPLMRLGRALGLVKGV